MIVAPFTGAWIEIRRKPRLSHSFGSLPSRERGLKLPLIYAPDVTDMSLPSRELGLK